MNINYTAMHHNIKVTSLGISRIFFSLVPAAFFKVHIEMYYAFAGFSLECGIVHIK